MFNPVCKSFAFKEERIIFGKSLFIILLIFHPVINFGEVMTISSTDVANVNIPVSCSDISEMKGSPQCLPSKCSRIIMDSDIFSPEDITNLHIIASKGMSQRPAEGGPTILDINTGYIRDSTGLENLFIKPNDIYDVTDFHHYAQTIQRLKLTLEAHFNLSDLYFTAPTFITRLDGRHSWQPKGVHDEYWHAHADRNNTSHYHYSGLLYMSDYHTDFEGGRLVFLSPSLSLSSAELIVEPKRGRLALFTSGSENPHYVERVTQGERYVLAFWFTCDVSRSFPIYLDGAAHVSYSHSIREKLAAKEKQKEREKKIKTEKNKEL